MVAWLGFKDEDFLNAEGAKVSQRTQKNTKEDKNRETKEEKQKRKLNEDKNPQRLNPM
jgi:hypothetical protein